MSIDTKRQPTTTTSELQEFELEYQIRLRAYELYEARGRKDGHELDDWLRAKEEIREKKFRPGPAGRFPTRKVSGPTPRGVFHASRRVSGASPPAPTCRDRTPKSRTGERKALSCYCARVFRTRSPRPPQLGGVSSGLMPRSNA